VLALGLLVGCEDTPSEVPAEENVALTAAEDGNGVRVTPTFEITVTNLTTAQPFTPPVAITHSKNFDAFSVRTRASHEIQEVAENGNIQPLVDLASADSEVADVVVALGAIPPILPGETRTFQITAVEGKPYLSFVSMLICTNDGFAGLDAGRLNGRMGQTRSWRVFGYDASTERNTEDFADMVPPCAPLTNTPSTDPGTGMSNPALAEEGLIRHHRGVRRIADLLEKHDWRGPVARVTATRIQ